MIPILAVTLPLLAASGDCFFVTNTRMLVLPTCDIGPATIDRLSEEAAPQRGPVQPPRRHAGTFRRGAAPPTCTTVVRGNEELEHRIERAEQDRLAAEVARLQAERDRDLARQQLARALQELTQARPERVVAPAPPRRGAASSAGRHHAGAPATESTGPAPAQARSDG